MKNDLVSIIIPTYKDWGRLAACLEALRIQDYPKEDFEILVVNNAPEDTMPDGFDLPNNASVIEEAAPGSYAARNKGLQLAKGSIIGFTDSDCIPDRNWIMGAVSHFKEHLELKRLTGPINIFSKTQRPSLLEYHDMVYAFPQDRKSKSGTCVTANLFTYAAVFDRVGSFNANTMSGGDIEWGRRAHALEQPLGFSDAVLVRHPARATYAEIFKKAKRVGKGQLVLVTKPITLKNVLRSAGHILRPKTWEWKKLNTKAPQLSIPVKFGVFCIRNLYLMYIDYYRTLRMIQKYFKN